MPKDEYHSQIDTLNELLRVHNPDPERLRHVEEVVIPIPLRKKYKSTRGGSVRLVCHRNSWGAIERASVSTPQKL